MVVKIHNRMNVFLTINSVKIPPHETELVEIPDKDSIKHLIQKNFITAKYVDEKDLVTKSPEKIVRRRTRNRQTTITNNITESE